mgnify:CR=1 FL=1
MARLVISQTAPTRHTVVVNQTVSPITLEITEQVSQHSVVVSPLTVTNYYAGGGQVNAALTGVAPNSNDLGTFTGSTISANQSIKGGLQDLETAVDDNAVDIAAVSNVANANTSAINTNATDITNLTANVQANTTALIGVEANAKDDQDASEVPVSATPSNYTAGSSDVEAHLAAIDAALANVGSGGGQLQASLDPTETQLFFTDPGTYAAGTDIEDVLRDLLIHFQPPSVTNFVANGLPNSAIEHGASDTLTTASWVVTNSGNVDGTVTGTLEYQDPLNVQDESWTGIAHTSSPYAINKDVIFNVVTGSAGQGSTVRGQTNTYFLRFEGLKNTQGAQLTTRTDYFTVLYRTFVLTSPTAIAAGAVTHTTGEGLIADCIAGTNSATVAYNDLHANSLLQTTLTYPSTTQYWYVAMPQCHWEYANKITTNQGFVGFPITTTVVDCGSFFYQNANSQDVAMQLLRGPSLGQIDSGNYIKFEYDPNSALNSVSAPAARTGGGGGSSASGFLVDYPGAAAAYSTRQLISTATNAMRVRRVSDDQETDIGFDSNGDLNTAAIATHCGSSEGYVSKWYDQSGNGRDAEQSIGSKQPQIYNGTAVITTNGKPAIDSYTAQAGLSLSYSRTVTSQSHFAVAETQQGSSLRMITQFVSGETLDYGPASEAYIPIIYHNALGSYANGYKSTQAASAGQHSISSIHTGSSLTNYLDGNAATSASHTLNATFVNYHIKTGWTQIMTGTTQEVILFDSDQTSNRSAIEGNVNAHFQIGNFGTPTSGLLSTYTGPAIAYSVRQLANTATKCLRVRRDNDDAEQDFGFDANGDLDTAAIATFVGSGNNGYVSKWYDQSGNGNHGNQTASSDQPQIYDGTAVITENGKPAVAGGNMDLSSVISQTTKNLGYFVVNKQNSGHFSWVLGTSFSNQHNLVLERFGKVQFRHPTDGLIDIAGQGTMTMGQQNLIYAMSNNTKLDARVNASDVGDSSPFSAVSSSISALYNARFGLNAPTTTKFQEIILYQSDQSSNVSDIETDINDYFQIGNFGTPTSGLLSTYTGAAAAYSVRQLANTAIKCMRVRRDNDDAEQDFGFDANGDLDTAAIATFVGSGNNGYVSKWYDQGGNQNDAAQSTNGSQPQIYNGSAVITENGKPAIDFDGTNDLPMSTQFLTAPATDPEKHLVCVLSPTRRYSPSYNIRQPYDFSQTSSGNAYVGMTIREAAGGVRTFVVTDNPGGAKEQSSADTTQLQNLVSHSMDLTSGARVHNAYLNGSLMTGTADGYNSGSGNQISNAYSFVRDYTGSMQEIIFWNADQSSNRSGIETDINNYFSIY